VTLAKSLEYYSEWPLDKLPMSVHTGSVELMDDLDDWVNWFPSEIHPHCLFYHEMAVAHEMPIMYHFVPVQCFRCLEFLGKTSFYHCSKCWVSLCMKCSKRWYPDFLNKVWWSLHVGLKEFRLEMPCLRQLADKRHD
jgi:hypothetical protein